MKNDSNKLLLIVDLLLFLAESNSNITDEENLEFLILYHSCVYVMNAYLKNSLYLEATQK